MRTLVVLATLAVATGLAAPAYADPSPDGSFLGGLMMFAVLLCGARWATATDPQILRILLNSSKFKVRYDPAKQAPSQEICRRG